MNLTAENITTDATRAIFHALMTAAEKSRRIMRMAEDGDISVGDAAEKLNSILSTLNLELADAADPAPPVPANLANDLVGNEPEFRYFTNGGAFWKMPKMGDGFVRSLRGKWERSILDLFDCLGDSYLRELTAEEAGP